MKSPSIIVVCKFVDFLSFPTVDESVYYSDILPFLVEYALN